MLLSLKDLWDKIVEWGWSMYYKYPWWKAINNTYLHLWDNFKPYVILAFVAIGLLILLLIIIRIVRRFKRRLKKATKKLEKAQKRLYYAELRYERRLAEYEGRYGKKEPKAEFEPDEEENILPTLQPLDNEYDVVSEDPQYHDLVEEAPVEIEPEAMEEPVILEEPETEIEEVTLQPNNEEFDDQEESNEEFDDQEESNEEFDPFANAKSRSFAEKMINASQENKDYYNTIKNRLLSYGIKVTYSKGGDTFKYKNKAVSKINLVGKTLRLYLALNPSEYEESRFHHKDMSDIKKYERVPLMLRVKSDLGLRRALILIDELASKLELTLIEGYTDKDFIPELITIFNCDPILEEVIQKEPTPIEEPIEEKPIEEEPVNEENEDDNEEGFDLSSIKSKPHCVKMANTTEFNQQNYNTLCNELVSYGLVYQYSKTGDGFKYKNRGVARIRLVGKTLRLYLALDPNKYEVSRYHQKDVSNIKKYESTPLMLRIKSDLALRRALSLVEELANKLELTKEDNSFVDYMESIKADALAYNLENPE